MNYEVTNKWVLIYNDQTKAIETSFYSDGLTKTDTDEVLKQFDTQDAMNQFIIDNNLINNQL